MNYNKWLLRIAVIETVLVALLVLGMVWEKPAHAQLAASTGFSYSNITSATNTPMKSGQATFHSLVINGGTLTGVITVKDTTAADCSGGVTIATIAQPQVAGQVYAYNLQTVNGLCITTAGAVNATAMFR